MIVFLHSQHFFWAKTATTYASFIWWLGNTNHSECCWEPRANGNKTLWLVNMAVIKFTQQERLSLIQFDWTQVLKSGPQFPHLALGGSLRPGAGCYRSKSTNVLWHIHRDWLPLVGKTSLEQEGRRHDTKRRTWVLCLWQTWKLWKWPWRITLREVKGEGKGREDTGTR